MTSELAQMLFAKDQDMIQESRLYVAIRRSTYEFCQGDLEETAQA